MKAQYIAYPGMSHVLALLTPDNRLAMEIALHTGLRIGDVLALRKESIKRRMAVIEKKTGKRRSFSLTADLESRARQDGAPGFVFPHARDSAKHRTRQAVWKDVKRAARALRYKGVSPHSARKMYAVKYYNNHGKDMVMTQKNLNHDRMSTTILYALADIIDDYAKK